MHTGTTIYEELQRNVPKLHLPPVNSLDILPPKTEYKVRVCVCSRAKNGTQGSCVCMLLSERAC